MGLPRSWRRSWIVDYSTVEKLFDVIADYHREMPPPQELEVPGEWIKVATVFKGPITVSAF